MRSRLLAALALLSLLAAAAVLVTAVRDRPVPTLAERADALSHELRCPVCAGETIADSQSDVAVAMRAEISAQLQQGRSPAQVRSWFAQRYGGDVVLRPAQDGAGLLVWLLPVVAVGVGALVVARVVGPADRRAGRGRRLAVLVAGTAGLAVLAPLLVPDEPGGGAAAPALAAASTSEVPSEMSSEVPPEVPSAVARGRALDEQGRHDEAAQAYRAALDAGGDDEVRLLLAFALVRTGQADDAVPMLRDVLTRRPDEPEALLVLGAALRDDDPAAARTALRRFLAVAPGHAAAPGVRRALGDPP